MQTIKRFKRDLDLLDDDDDDDDIDDSVVKYAQRLTRRSRSKITKPRHAKNKNKKALKRDFIGMPYIPGRGALGAEFSRQPFDEMVMEDEMSALPSSQPVGMASEFQPTNYDPIEDASRSGYASNPSSESPGPNPLRLQETYERSSSWEPVGTNSRFSQEDEFNYGLPDKNYERSIEGDAQRVDDRFLSSYFKEAKRGLSYDGEKRDNEPKLSLLDSLGIGESEIDQRYLSEAKNIQDYLGRSEQLASSRSLGHDSRQHNNIQVGLSPELLRENPNVWNMMDTASYTPMSQQAESLTPSSDSSDAQVLQSQNSMGRVFVPLSLENLAQRVHDEVQRHYTVPSQPVPLPGTRSDRAVPNYPNIIKSFYPNVPFQTVRGASFNPPDTSDAGYRSMINHPYGQPTFMQPNLQPMPMMMPFSGMPYQARGQMPMWGPVPVPMISGAFPMPMMGPGPYGAGEMASERIEIEENNMERKGPGTLTVKSTENGDDAKEEQVKSADFEGNF